MRNRRWLIAVAALVPRAVLGQWAQITFISPANSAVLTSPSVDINWYGCTTVTPTSYQTYVNGTAVSTSFTTSGCPDWTVRRKYSATGTLVAGPNNIGAEVCSNQSPACIDTSITVYYGVGIAVKPDDGAAEVVNAQSGSYVFTIQNTSAYSDSANVSVSCTTHLTSCAVTPTKVWLPTNGSATVTVSYSGSSTGDAVATVTAAYVHVPVVSDVGTVNVVVQKKVASVTVVRSGFATIGVGQKAPFSARTYAADGTELFGRAVTWSATNGSVSPTTGVSPAGTIDSATATGTGTITARSEGVSGSATVTIVSTSFLSVATAGLNPRGTIDRAGCLTIAAGENAAYECGDLRIVHPLPTTVTMNKPRTPMLIYSSALAEARAWLAADVLYSGTTPDTLVATVTITGQPTIIRKYAWNSSCATQTCRIVVPIHLDSTWVWQPSLTVAAKSGGTTLLTSAAVTDTVVTVDRSKSRFGAGWWLDGFERLVRINSTKRLWIGGDGSARLYTKATDSVYLVTPGFDRPDTLRLRSNGNWRRRIPNGAYVEFDTSGRHILTVTGLGWTTTFAYDATGVGHPLKTVTLPVPSGSSQVRQYTFAYDTSSGAPVLSTVTAPAAGGARVVSTTRSNQVRLQRIIDPDGDTTSFSFLSSTSNLIDERRNRLSDTTYFTYDDALKLTTVSLGMSRTGGSAITSDFRAAESKSARVFADQPRPLSKIYTLFDGPRSVDDTTMFFVSEWGAPDTVLNALGGRTRVERGNSSFASLVTTSVDAGGFRRQAWYNARGLVDSVRELNPNGDYHNAVTRYKWHSTWNHVTSVVLPTGDSASFTYSATEPTRTTQDVGTDATRRVQFWYYSDTHLLRSIKVPVSTANDSIEYDGSLGNLSKTVTPSGFERRYTRDVVGRDSLIKVQVDAGKTLWLSTTTYYDVMGRVSQTSSVGPPVTISTGQTIGPQTALVQMTYDPVGNPRTVSRSSSPDSAGIGTLVNRYVYDAASRLVADTAPDNKVELRGYNSAGDLTSITTRRGQTLTMTYDELNRLTSRGIPPDTSPAQSVGIGARSLRGVGVKPYPWFPTNQTTGAYVIPADTENFSYDAVGRIAHAENSDAFVRRTYTPAGLLKTDTTKIRTLVTRDTVTHVYGVDYKYDLSGRRIRVRHPSQLAPAGSSQPQDSVNYVYDSIGQLQSVRDVLGNTFTFTYNTRGDRIRTALPGGVRDSAAYDNDARYVQSYVFNTTGTQNQPYPDTLLRSDILAYDPAGRVISYKNGQGIADTMFADYAGIGHLVHRDRRQPVISAYGRVGVVRAVEDFSLDALGNRFRSYTTDSVPNASTSQAATWRYQAAGRQRGIDYQSPAALTHDTVRYNGSGDVILSYTTDSFDPQQNPTLSDRALFYGADGRLRASERRTVNVLYPQFEYQWAWTMFFEEYRYDPLGRRVLTRMRRGCSAAFDPVPDTWCTLGTVRRTVWDGDAELYEIQMPDTVYAENDTAHIKNRSVVSNQVYVDPNPQYGRVAYTYGSALDRPLSVTRINYVDTLQNTAGYAFYPSFAFAPHWNWHGNADLGTGSDGGSVYCYAAPGRCAGPTWRHQSFAFVFNPSDTVAGWYGTLVYDGEDQTGTLFRRNRYADPNTGRFTQEDPIGIAGAMNLYGFANGDPINFSDPYGLCPVEVDGIPCAVTYAAAGAGIGAGVAAVSTGVCAAGTFGVCGLATPGTIAGGAAAGAVIGGLIGSAIDNRDAIAAQAQNFGDRLKGKIRRGLIILGGIAGIGAQEIPPGPPPEEKKKKAKEEQVDKEKGSGSP